MGWDGDLMGSAKSIIYKLVSEQKLSPRDAAILFSEMQGKKTNEDIAIIGMSGRFPKAKNLDEYWSNIRQGENCIGSFPENRRKDTDKLASLLVSAGYTPGSLDRLEDLYAIGGYLDEVDKFDASFFRISPNEAKWMHPSHRLFLMTAFEAIEDAGYSAGSIGGTNTGVYVGVDHTFVSEYGQFKFMLDPSSVTGAWTSILASRVSYQLDLRGPGVVVDTACSSGLISVHMACKAIKNNECEMAIAGGVSLSLTPFGFKSLEMVESSDNQVKTFDRKANGTVWGEGIAALLLKPLRKALADNDNIYAVIKGSAINNDGTSSALTAPNAEAQEEVIVRAWEEAGIDPETISYIEAHGTGTVLGDPIEIKGLNMAFERYTDRKQFCGIGSVKTNIGHLVGASGIASLIKVVLSMKNKEIPPSINFSEPNPYINFCNSPFYVNDVGVRWEADHPRRAGISSFGFSGTNCHMVIEEAPKVVVEENGGLERTHIFTLSAKTENALNDLLDKYKDFLAKNSGLDIRDICHTVNMGRDHYSCRIAMVVNSADEVKELLDKINISKIKDFQPENVYFGVHKIVSANKVQKEAFDITEREKNALNEMAAQRVLALENESGYEAIAHELCRLYIEGADIPWDHLYKDRQRRKLSLPTYSFEKTRHWAEYQLFNFLMADDGKREEGIDKNIGKYSPLLDRSLLDTVYHETFLTELSVDKYWILKEYKAFGKYVVPGTAYIEFIAEACRKYHPKDALEIKDIVFMSPLFVREDEIKEVYTFIKKEKDYFEVIISSKQQTGDHWVTHVKARVQGSKKQDMPMCDIQEILKRCSLEEMTHFDLGNTGGGIFQFGPRWNNIRRVSMGKDEILTELENPEVFMEDFEGYHTYPSLLDNAVNIIISTTEEGYYVPCRYKSIKLYNKMPQRFFSHIRFDRNKKGSEIISFDIRLVDEYGNIFAEIEDYTIKKLNNHEVRFGQFASDQDVYYEVGWKNTEMNLQFPDHSSWNILVLGDDTKIAQSLVTAFKASGTHVIGVRAGNGYNRIDSENFTIGASEEDYTKLFAALKDRGITHIIHLLTMAENADINDLDSFESMKEKGVYSLFYITRALMANMKNQKTEIVLISDYVNEVTGEEDRINPHNAAMFGLGKAVGMECGNLNLRCIDIDKETTVENIFMELGARDKAYIAAYRKNKRYIEEFRRLDIEREDREFNIRENGVYVITGGIGGIGLEAARYIASKNRAKICLINRSAFPGKETWDVILEDGSNKKACDRIRSVREIESIGSEVTLYSADVSKENELAEVLNKIREKHGRINGIIHCAGVAGDRIITTRKEKERFEKVIAPKMQGTWLLDRLTEQDILDFFILFSSISTLVTGPGQGDYTAANSYMDSFAAFRNKKDKRTLAINWPAWKETGMAADLGFADTEAILKPISTFNAVNAFESVLVTRLKRVVIGEPDYDILTIARDHSLINLSQELDRILERRSTYIESSLKLQNHVRSPRDILSGGMTQSKEAYPKVRLKGRRAEECYTVTEKQLAQLWGILLGVEEIDINDSFEELGGNSIFAIKLETEIEKYNIPANQSDIYNYPTIKSFAAYIDSKLDSGNPNRLIENGDNEDVCKKAVGEVEEENTDKAGESIQLDTSEGNVRISQSVEPFNDVYYKNCFYNSLFAVVNSLNKNPLQFLINDVTVYEYNEEKGNIKFDAVFSPMDDMRKLFYDAGIYAEIKEVSSDIIGDILSAISKDRAVIVWIDLFYDSMRLDMYNVAHWPHTLMVYGYNETEKTLDIIEHRHRENLRYEKLTINWSDLVNSYKGYIDNFKNNIQEPTYYEFFSASNDQSAFDINKCISTYTRNINERKEMILSGLENIKIFGKDLERIFASESDLKESAEVLLNTLNNILNVKRAEKYKVEKLFGPRHELNKHLYGIIDSWGLIRKAVARYSYTSLYNQKELTEAVNILNKIYKLECMYNEKLFEVNR